MSNLHRLRVTDRIFLVCVNVRAGFREFDESEYALLADVLKESRERLGFLLYGYVLMPDHWHALIWTRYPLRISEVLHDAKKIMTLRLRRRRGTRWVRRLTDSINSGIDSCAMKKNSITASSTCI